MEKLPNRFRYPWKGSFLLGGFMRIHTCELQGDVDICSREEDYEAFMGMRIDYVFGWRGCLSSPGVNYYMETYTLTIL